MQVYELLSEKVSIPTLYERDLTEGADLCFIVVQPVILPVAILGEPSFLNHVRLSNL